MGKENPSRPLTARVLPYAFLVLLCLVLYLPGISALPPVDRDEARYAQATSQMLETGDFVRIRFQDEGRNKKPVGIYWLQAASVALAGDLEARRIWPYRIPSVLGAILCALFTFSIGKRFFDRQTGLLAAVLLVSTPLFAIQGHLAKTDAVLLATVVAAQGALCRFYLQKDKEPPGTGAFLTFWIAQAIGVLIKGPVTPLVSILTAGWLAAFDRDIAWLKTLKPVRGVLLAAAIVCPWAIAIAIDTKGLFFEQSIGGDILSKVVSGTESHGFIPGYYLLLMPLTLWPASLLAGAAVVRAWKERARPIVMFCLAWIVPTWVFFELIPTKLPHYVLPTYPALCLLVAEIVRRGEYGGAPELNSKLVRTGFISCTLVLLFLGFGTCALPWFLDHRFDPVSLAAVAAAVVASGASIRKYFQGRFVHAVAIATAGTAVVLCTAFQWVLPNVDALWLSRTVSEAAKAAAGGNRVELASAGYHEPSLVFLLGTDTLLTHSEGAAHFLADHPKGLALVSGDEEKAFQNATSAQNVHVKLVGTFRGVNYSKGKKAVLRLYGTAGTQEAGEK